MSRSLLSCLSALSIEENRRVAHAWGLWLNTSSKQTLMRELYERLTDAERLRQALLELDPDERLVAEHLARHLHRHPDQADQVGRLVYGLLGTRTGRADRVLDSLVEKGFLFLPAGRQGSPVFPVEMAERLHRLVGAAGGPWMVRQEEEPARVLPAQAFLAHDVVSFLAAIRKGTVRLTQGGVIFQRTLVGLEQRRIVRRGPTPLPELSEHLLLPQGVDLLRAFSEETGLVGSDARQLAPTGSGEEMLAALRTRRLADWCRQMHLFLERRYVRESPVLAQLWGALRESEPAAWHRLAPILEHLAAQARSSWEAQREQAAMLWLISALHETLALDLGADAALSEWSLRLTPEGRALLAGETLPPAERASGELHVLPDFTLLAPFQMETDERWQLESFADLASCDAIFTYRITRDSIYRALKQGVEVESIFAFLAAHGERRIPQNVEYSVREWAAGFGRIHFADVLLLRCESEALAEEVVAAPEIARHVQGRITPRDLLVARTGYAEIVKALERMGHLPRPLRD